MSRPPNWYEIENLTVTTDLTMAVRIESGEKFSCFAFTHFSVRDDVPDELGVSSVWVLRSLPVDVESHWREWLGSIQIDALRQSNFVLCTTTPSQHPEVVDGENQELTRKLDHIFYGLLLQGVPYYEDGFSLSGANVHGEVQVRSFSDLKDYEPS